MPEIYHHTHPYWSPGDNRYHSPSMMHQIIFGNGLEHTFPESLHILSHHKSNWFHMCSDYSNERTTDYFNDYVALGEFIRKYMVGDVFITQNKVDYYHPEGEHKGSWENEYEDYYKKDSDGKLIRLPVHCIINYVSIYFRNEVDKTQFQLMNDGQFCFMDELETDRIKKARDSYNNKTRNILCPICKVNYNDTNNKQNNC